MVSFISSKNGPSYLPKLRLQIFLKSRIIIVFIIFVGIMCLTHYKNVIFKSAIGFLSTITLPISGVPERTLNSNASFSIDTSTCKIPNFDPWDKSAHLQKERCQEKDLRNPGCGASPNRKWMYVENSNLVVNLTSLKISGIDWDSGLIHCCFRVIRRATNLGKYNDETVTYSKECYQISQTRTKMIDEFIRVQCFSTSSPFEFMDVLYREYFAFALPTSAAREKISKWKQLVPAKTEDLPPNVIILGVDSNSRLNSRRWLPKTVKLFKQLDAVEMLGYTKVGENTYPNTVPFLTGLHTWEMEPHYCKRLDATHDACPYVWKAFSRAGYLTAMAEDVPYSTCFNLNAYGFENKPTDFYYRPFPFAISKRGPRERGGIIKCIGRYQSEEILLNYISNALKVANPAPTFVFTWLQAFSHECSQSVRFIDDSLSGFIANVTTSSNSIIFFISDHGERYGPFRETTLGWYEDKLPTMWVYLPLEIRRKFPDWISALKSNANRLTSPFDLYHTFIDILNTFDVNKTFNVNETIPKNLKNCHSLFSTIPENRVCADAGIPNAFCACVQPHALDLANSVIRNTTESAINAAFEYLKHTLPDQCSVLKLERILSAKLMKSPEGPEVYVINVISKPGDFQLEVTVGDKDPSSNNFIISDFSNILRLDKMRGNYECVKNRVFQRYCFCK